MPRVVYLDPLWAIDTEGRVDPALAAIEREALGADVALVLGELDERGVFARSGPVAEALVRGADALVISRAQITPELLASAGPQCRVIGRLGVGYDNLNVPLLRERGIFGFNVPDYCVDEVSTHALALVLALERRLGELDRAIKSGTWNTYAGPAPRRLSDATIGIVGFGTIGRAFARKAQALFGTVAAYDPYVHADLMAGFGVKKLDSIGALFAAADAVSIHALLSDETRGLIDAAILAAARPGTLLVNTARGDIVVPSAVLAALRSGRLAGYGSDVFAPEDPNLDPDNRALLALANVIVTPHSAFRSAASERSQRARVAQTIARVLTTGEPPRFGRLA
jgi:D-3-phosphoglycerate dehydrogenase